MYHTQTYKKVSCTHRLKPTGSQVLLPYRFCSDYQKKMNCMFGGLNILKNSPNLARTSVLVYIYVSCGFCWWAWRNALATPFKRRHYQHLSPISTKIGTRVDRAHTHQKVWGYLWAKPNRKSAILNSVVISGVFHVLHLNELLLQDCWD